MIFIVSFFCLALNIALGIFLYFWLYAKVKDAISVPLHYNIYFGIDLVGAPRRLFFLPAFGSLVWLLNSCLAYWLYTKEKVLSHFLVFGALAVQLILILADIFITIINS
jgi:hypothetical protein